MGAEGVMPEHVHDPILRQLDRAEGFLMLDLPERALEILQSRSDWTTMAFEANLLMGEALRQLDRYREAIGPLERAAALRPSHAGVAIRLGWCYKRTHRIAQAIDALERALLESPDDPLLRYNLGCYWSLVGDRIRALKELGAAIDLDPDFRARATNEPDFDTLRGNVDFERLLLDRAPEPR